MHVEEDQSLLALLSHLFDLCQGDIASRGLPKGRSYVQFTDKGRYERRIEEPRFDIVVDRVLLDRQWEGHPSVLPAVETMVRQGTTAGWNVRVDPKEPIEELAYWAVMQLSEPLTEHLTNNPAPPFNAAIALESYERYRVHWTTNQQACRITVPLWGLKSDLAELVLDNSVKICAFSPEEKTRLWQGFLADFGLANIFTYESTDYCLSITESPRPRPSTPEPLLHSARLAISAIRLAHDGEVFAGPTFAELLPPKIFKPTFQDVPYELQLHRGPFAARYLLKSDDSDVVSDIFRSLRACLPDNNAGSLSLALRRFNLSYAREAPDDQIIDLAVALDASVLADADRDLAYKLLVRGTALLAGTPEVNEQSATLAALYSARNKLVHGSKSFRDLKKQELRQIDPAMLLTHSRAVVRAVLAKYLHRIAAGSTLKSINNELDELVLKRVGA